jgi:capsular polysaccharide transport system ATP-binding protein
MRARLAFGLSMAVEFDVYLVDEVTAVGDVPFQEKCRAAFAERRERSFVIMVSHQLSTLRQYCTRFALLRDGKLEMYDDLALVEQAYRAAA